MRDVRTSIVEKYTYVNYLKRAEQCLSAAAYSLKNGDTDASAINSVHRGISAVDAICALKLECRHAGERHEDAAALIDNIQDIAKPEREYLRNRLLKLLRMKNMAEYEERQIKIREATELFKYAEELFNRIKSPAKE
ncbi:MAG: HEPN domain-containing protein [Spirochaetia bacterium]|nr:HEPN domain-containing protein [Spirochaetia bacterium]